MPKTISKVNSRRNHRSLSNSRSHVARHDAFHRLLRCEPLEDRRLLTQLILNGSFSQPISSADWITSGNFYADSTGAHTNYHTAPGYAYLSQPGGNPGNNLIGSMYQQFTVPTNATSVTLAYWYNITTTELGGTANDFLNVTIQNSSGQYLAGVGFYSNLNSGTVGQYSEASYDLSSFKGQTLRINFLGTTNASYPTAFRIDDVSVVATVPAAAPSITTVSPTSMPPSTSAQPIKVYGSNIDTSASHLLFTDPQGNVYSSANHPWYETRVSSSEFDYQIDNNSDTGTWKVNVQNPDGQVSNVVNFVVAAPVSAPIVSTTAASSVTANTAVMNGTVNPNGASTSAYFQYGTTTSYGNATQAQPAITTTTNVQTTLTGLAPDTTYHYRLVASNSGGTSYGSDMSFTTMNAAVALTLYVRAGSTSGPLLSGAQVTGQDAVGNTFSQTTNASGCVVLTGIPGMWQFAASAAGYPTNTWGQNITTTTTKTAYLVQQVASTEHLAFTQPPTDGTPGSIITPSVVVAIEDSHNNPVSSENSNVTLTLGSGTLGGTTTVAAVNGKATFTDLTVGVAGTYTLEATDGGDTPAYSTFAVGNSPRDQLIQALNNLEQAVSAYQTACINVFATADAPLAKSVVSNSTPGSLGSNVLVNLATGDFQGAAKVLINLATGNEAGLLEDFLKPLAGDLGTWLESSLTTWQYPKNLGSSPPPSDAVAAQYLLSYFNGQLSSTTGHLQTYLTNAESEIPLSPSPSDFSEMAILRGGLVDLTNDINAYAKGSLVGDVGWTVPGAPLAVAPFFLGATRADAQQVATEAKVADTTGKIANWVSIDGTALQGAGAIVAATGFGVGAGVTLYGLGQALDGAAGLVDLVNSAEEPLIQWTAVAGLENDVTASGQMVQQHRRAGRFASQFSADRLLDRPANRPTLRSEHYLGVD